MLRLMSKRKEIEEVIKQEHTSTCCANKYTLEIYMQEREQVKVFNEWFQNIYDTSVLGVDVLNADRIAHAMLLFTYTAAELRNQLKLKCVEKGKIVDNLLGLYFETLGSVISVMDYKIKNHDVIQELTQS